MKVTFKSSDPKEINRLAKSTDMAIFIFELVNNAWREFEGSEHEKYWAKINQLLDEYNIDIEDLIE